MDKEMCMNSEVRIYTANGLFDYSSFGVDASVAAPDTYLPSSHSYGYGFQSRHVPGTTTEASSSEIPAGDAG